MADEQKLGINLSVTNGDFSSVFQPGTVSINQAAIGMHAPTVIVTTGEVDLDTGDISTLGLIVGRNLDDTNFVTIGPSTGGPLHPFIRVKPSEPFAFRLEPGVTWRWVADSAPVKVQIQLYED